MDDADRDWTGSDRILERLGAEVRVFDPEGLPMKDGTSEHHPKVLAIAPPHETAAVLRRRQAPRFCDDGNNVEQSAWAGSHLRRMCMRSEGAHLIAQGVCRCVSPCHREGACDPRTLRVHAPPQAAARALRHGIC